MGAFLWALSNLNWDPLVYWANSCSMQEPKSHRMTLVYTSWVLHCGWLLRRKLKAVWSVGGNPGVAWGAGEQNRPQVHYPSPQSRDSSSDRAYCHPCRRYRAGHLGAGGAAAPAVSPSARRGRWRREISIVTEDARGAERGRAGARSPPRAPAGPARHPAARRPALGSDAKVSPGVALARTLPTAPALCGRRTMESASRCLETPRGGGGRMHCRPRWRAPRKTRVRARARGGWGGAGARGGWRGLGGERGGPGARGDRAPLPPLPARFSSPSPLAFTGGRSKRCSEATARGSRGGRRTSASSGREPASPRGSRLAASPQPSLGWVARAAGGRAGRRASRGSVSPPCVVPAGEDAALRSTAAAGAEAEEVQQESHERLQRRFAGHLWQPWLAVSTVWDFFFVTRFGYW